MKIFETWKDNIKIEIVSIERIEQSHLCCYLGIHNTHPLANKDYESIPLNVHGGLTYSGEDKKKIVYIFMVGTMHT